MIPKGKTLAKETLSPVSERSNPKESPKRSYSDALKIGTFQSLLNTSDYSPQLVTLMLKGKTLAKETHPPACGRGNQKESPKGSWMKRVRNYVHGIRKKEPP